MYNDADSPNSVLDGQDAGGQTSGLSISATPPRFGRLAMCVATASALAIGVLGTVAYSVWFNHDQQAYAEAMVGARRALGNSASASAAVMAKTAGVTALPAAAVLAKSPQPSPAASGAAVAASAAVADPEAGGRFASWSGQVKASAPRPDVVAEAAPAAPAPAPAAAPPIISTRRSASAANPPPQQLVAARPAKDGRATPQERRAAPESARHKNNLFARMGLFFRHVNYRQHGNANRQDIYSHP